MEINKYVVDVLRMLYALICAVTWLFYASYTDPKYIVLPDIAFWVTSLCNLGWIIYLMLSSKDASRERMYWVLSALTLLSVGEGLSVYVGGKLIALQWHFGAFITGGLVALLALYGADLLKKTIANIFRSKCSVLVKITVLSLLECIGMMYFLTFYFIYQRPFILIAEIGYLPNWWSVLLILGFWELLIIPLHMFAFQYPGKQMMYTSVRSWFQCGISLLLMTGVLAQIVLTDMYPYAMWMELFSTDVVNRWKEFIQIVKDWRSSIVIIVGLLVIAKTCFQKFFLLMNARRVEETGIKLNVLTSSLMAISLYLFLTTLPYAMLSSVARIHGCWYWGVLPYTYVVISPTYIAYIFMFGILFLMNYIFLPYNDRQRKTL